MRGNKVACTAASLCVHRAATTCMAQIARPRTQLPVAPPVEEGDDRQQEGTTGIDEDEPYRLGLYLQGETSSTPGSACALTCMSVHVGARSARRPRA